MVTLEHLKLGYAMGKKFVSMHDFKGKRALDVGCGHCAHTLAYAEKFDNVDAIDIENGVDRKLLSAISPAEKKIDFMQEDFLVYYFHKDFYDLVFTLSALEHISKWKEALGKMYHILKPGGLLQVVISPLYYSPLGHHLDPEIGEWSHILVPEVKLKKFFFDQGGQQWEWDLYKQLNKITAADFLALVEPNFIEEFLTISITTIHYVGRKP